MTTPVAIMCWAIGALILYGAFTGPNYLNANQTRAQWLTLLVLSLILAIIGVGVILLPIIVLAMSP